MKNDGEDEKLLLQSCRPLSGSSPHLSPAWLRSHQLWYSVSIVAMLIFFFAGLTIAPFWHQSLPPPTSSASASNNSPLLVFASTPTPFSCSGYSGAGSNADAPEKEAKRQRINAWICDGSPFDAVVDFDRMLRNPHNHSEYLPDYISGHCLHPSQDGLHAMANAFLLHLFEKFKNGVDGLI